VAPDQIVSDRARSGSFVVTKVAPPISASGLLPRAELVEGLVGRSCQLVLVSAPAGWGKTSLLASWAAAENERRQFAFLHLETGDDVGPIFWMYVIAALRTVCPDLMKSADQLLRSPGIDPMRRVVPSLLNELAEIDREIVLVLDDYHLVVADDIHESISYFLDHLVPSVQLVIATRSDPPLPLARLRASGELFEVRSDRLGFSDVEVAEFLRRRFSMDLDAPEIEVLAARTEGWPAALQLAGLSLQGMHDPKEFVERFGGDDRSVVDYLISEVMAKISRDRLDFLLRTSVLDRLTGSLCDVVAGVTGSASVLDDLERSGLFLVALDNRRRWYRYHHLFRDWLQHELGRRDAALIPDLHLRARSWHVDHGFLEPAITHSIKGKDPDGAAVLIDSLLGDWANANSSRVRQWLDQLPAMVVEAHPLCAAAQCRFEMANGEFSRGIAWADAAEAAVDSAPGEVGAMIETTVALYRAYGELFTGDLEVALTAASEIADRERSERTSSYALAVGLAGICTFWTIGALEAIPLLREAAVARERASLNDSVVVALLAAAYAEIGDWRAAETTAATAFARPDASSPYRFPDLMAAHYGLGRALVARGERDEGVAHIQRGLRLAHEWVEPVFIAYGCLTLADAVTGDTEKRALVCEARRLIEGGRGRGRITDLVTAAERKLTALRPVRQTVGTTAVPPLTKRERDVLRLLRSDLSLREIAGELYISYNTVKDHTKSIYRKLGVSSREAATEAGRDIDPV
jgi:LuxR family maltose regulon positive regulatory protein